MTNFEKWKQELTVDKLKKLSLDHCNYCPALKKCQTLLLTCPEIIQKWAEQEADE